MKLITRDTDYALRAICFIASRKETMISVSQLSRELNVPRPFLRKILQLLNKKRIFKSFKGKVGGFILAKAPEEIFLTDVMRIFQGKFRLNECFLKKIVCPSQKICPLRKRITRIEQYVLRELETISVASLLK